MDLLADFYRNELRPTSPALEPQPAEPEPLSFYDMPGARDINRVIQAMHNGGELTPEDQRIASNLDQNGQYYAPEDTQKINGWERLMPLNMAYGSTLQSVAQCFRDDGDRLSGIIDPVKREQFRAGISRLGDLEEQEKRFALAQFFSVCRPFQSKLPRDINMSIATAFRNIDALCNLYTDGGSINEAFEKAKETLTYDASNPAASMPKWMKANIAMQSGVADVGVSLYNLASVPLYMVGAHDAGDAVQEWKHKLYDQYAEAQRDYGIPSDWMTNSDGFCDWVFNAAVSTMAYMPSLAVQVAVGTFAPAAAPALGAVFAIDDYFEIRHEKPEASAGQALMHAAAIGVINGFSEKFTLNIATGQLQKLYVKNGLGHGFKRVAAYIGVDTLSNSGQEAIEQLAENASDLACGVADKKFSEMTGAERIAYLWRGVPESAFLGATTGAMLSAGNVKSAQKLYDQTAQGYRAIKREKTNLDTKVADGKPLTEEEAARLRYYNNAMDSADAEACYNAAIADRQWQAAKAIKEEGERRKAEREAQELDPDPDAPNIPADKKTKEYFADDEEAGDVSEQTIRAAEQAEHNLRMREANGTHDIADTIRTTVSFFEKIPNVKFRILNSEQEIPQAIIDDLAADGIKPSQMQAAVGKDGVVYIRADKVRPSEVEHVLTHETIGHIGLESFMGGKFVSFLDDVYDQHYKEMDDIRKLYKLGEQEDSAATRRKITREWLAEQAAKSVDTRPDFWTRITGQLRLLLHKLGFKSYWSDRDLTALFIADRKQLAKTTPKIIRENIDAANAPSGLQGQVVQNDVPTRSGVSPSIASKYSSADAHDFIAVLKTAVGTRANKLDSVEKWTNFCNDHQLKIDAEDVMTFVNEARASNRFDAHWEHIRAVEDYIVETDPIFNGLFQLGYSPREVYNAKIIPTAERSGGQEVFTGTFMHESVRGKESHADTDAGRKSRERRAMRQHNAAMEGTNLRADDLASQINRKLGTSYTDEDIELHFRNLSWEDLESKYRDHLQDEKDLADMYKEMGLEEEKKRIEEEAQQLAENPQPLTMEYAQENPRVVKRLWEIITPPNKDGKWSFSINEKNLAKLNEKLTIASKDPGAITELFKNQRDRQRKDYISRLNSLKKNIRQRNMDIMQLQRDARAFVDSALPEAERMKFYDMIMKLPSYGYTPTMRNPEGRRTAEFYKILDKVRERHEEVKRELNIADIKKMLDSVKQKRNYKNIPVSVIPSEQATVDYIRQVVSWSPQAVASAMDYNVKMLQFLDEQSQILTKDMQSEISHKRDETEKNIYFIAKFGNLEYRKADEAETARNELQNIIKGAKSEYKQALEERAAELNKQRSELINKLTGNKLTDDKAETGLLTKLINNNATLKTMLAYIEGDPVDFDNTWSGQLYRRIEDATYNSAAERLHQDEALQKAFAEIYGATKAKQRAKVIQDLRQKQDKTGATIRFYNRVNGDLTFEGRHGAVRLPVKIEDADGKYGARTIVQLYDACNGDPGKINDLFHDIMLSDKFLTSDHRSAGLITPASIEWLRQQIADADAGVQRLQDVFGDDLDNTALERMKEENEAKDVEIIYDSPKTEYELREITDITKAQALQIILTWEQDGYRDAMQWNGYTYETIDALKKFVGDKNLQFGYWMRDRIAANRDALDKAVFDRFGAHLPDNEKYWPGRFKNDRGSIIRPQGHDAVSSLSITPEFLTARRFHLQPVATDVDAIEVFLNNQNQQIQMLNFGEVMRDAQGVLGNANVQKALLNKYGEHAPRLIMQLLGNIANQGAISDNISTAVGSMYSAYIPAKIGLNPASLIKQVLGGASYALDVPIKEMAGAMIDVMRLTPEYRHFRKLAKNSDYFKARTNQGANPELQYINEKQLYGNAGLLKGLTDFATKWTTDADAFSTLTVGYSCFKYAHDNAIKAGKTAEEADKIAMRAWQIATDETQQSGALKDANQYMAARGMARAFTMFMSNPIQTMQNEVRAYRAWQNAAGDAKNDAFKKFARIATVNHLVVPSLMYFVTRMFRDGINPLDWEWDKSDLAEMLAATMLGSFEGLFLYGVLVKGLITALTGGSTTRTPEAVPALEGIIKGGATTNKIATALMEGEEITAQDILSFTAGAGAILEPAGILWQPLGDAGMLLDITGTQGKRAVRMYESLTNSNTSKKKRK